MAGRTDIERVAHLLKAADAIADGWTAAAVRLRLALCLVAVVVAGVDAPAAGAAVSSDSVGVYSEELERANSVDRVVVAAAQHAAGAGLVRQPFSWARIETAPGELDFSVYDDVVAAAASAGLVVLPVLMDPPPWRSAAPATGALRGMYPPRDPADMAVLASALVQRYGPGGSFWVGHPELPVIPIRSWQVWNEPNIPAFWATGPDPVAYVRLLAAVGSAIRAADPRAEVVAAGLPYAGNGMSISDFIAAMYANGARGTFDTIAIHPYASSPAAVLAILKSVRQQLDRLGDPSRLIWATEFGWATGGPPVTITTSETAQSKLLGETIALMTQARDTLHLRGFVAFRWRDVEPNYGQADVWALHTGLLREDGSAKPALGGFRAAATNWFGGSVDSGQSAGSPGGSPSPASSPRAGSSPGPASSPRAGSSPGDFPGISRRVLRIRRSVAHGRLLVLVDAPAGGRAGRVLISYQAIGSDGRVRFQETRLVAARERVARVIFKLPGHTRPIVLLRVTASQGGVRASRLLRLRRPLTPRRL